MILVLELFMGHGSLRVAVSVLSVGLGIRV